ncbi:GNAT family N-acetyltransferase [Candidatus Parcubacteria bacterium]|nr:GNAT family N-acetyltransferase [Candidatus Parcubacteria bacterium]
MNRIKVVLTEEKYVDFAGDIQQMIEVEAKNHKMLQRSESDITAKICSEESVLALRGKDVVGYVELDLWGSKARFGNRLLLEIGGLIVKPEYRGQQQGTKLAKKALKLAQKKYPGRVVVALGNEKSRNIFKKQNFVPLPKCCLPERLWEPCSHCDDFSSFPACRCEALLQREARFNIDFVGLEAEGPFMKGLAELYCQVWQEPPWNEDFWKPNEVIVDIREALKKPCAMGYIVMASAYVTPPIWGGGSGTPPTEKQYVAGFTLGYEVTKEEMVEISGHQQLNNLFNGTRVFYIDELAIAKNHRQKGLATEISWRLLRFAESQGIGVVVLRTNKKAKAARALYQKLGFKELAIVDAVYQDRTYWALNLLPGRAVA